MAEQTTQRMLEVAHRFARRLEVAGVNELGEVTAQACEDFVMAPSRTGGIPSVSTQRMRRTTLRAIFRSARAAGHAIGDPTLDLWLPERGPDGTRPLTTAEVEYCRTCVERVSARDLRRTAAWALAEAGALTSEIAQIRVGDLDDPATPTSVALAGTSRMRARRVTLTEWGRSRLAARVEELGDPAPSTALLAYGGTQPPDSAAAQAATCRLVGCVLAEAGLGAEEGVRPASVRLWRARERFVESGSLEAAARLLGHRSLDETAAAVGYDWEQQ